MKIYKVLYLPGGWIITQDLTEACPTHAIWYTYENALNFVINYTGNGKLCGPPGMFEGCYFLNRPYKLIEYFEVIEDWIEVDNV